MKEKAENSAPAAPWPTHTFKLLDSVKTENRKEKKKEKKKGQRLAHPPRCAPVDITFVYKDIGSRGKQKSKISLYRVVYPSLPAYPSKCIKYLDRPRGIK